MWTGSATVVIPGSEGGHAPAISGQKVVWHASDGSDDEIYLWNGSTTQALTDNAIDDRNADISGNRVAWESADGIEVWLSGETSLVAGSAGGHFPKIDGIDVVWQAPGESGNEIYLVTLCVACNDGVDNDGDAKIDYDGGLSALGYVAAEADPQCGDNPWKKAEAAYNPCGLGAELALLLPALLWLTGGAGEDSDRVALRRGPMRRFLAFSVLLFALPAHAVTIDWVTVGDPGNACDTACTDGTTGSARWTTSTGSASTRSPTPSTPSS